jgi:hypothetical protein
VIGDARGHRRRLPVERAVDAAEVVVEEVQRDGRGEVLHLLAERVFVGVTSGVAAVPAGSCSLARCLAPLLWGQLLSASATALQATAPTELNGGPVLPSIGIMLRRVANSLVDELFR